MSKTVYEIVTDRIVEGLQDKGLRWFRPWTNADGNFEVPINNTTGIAYKGVNLFLLGATAVAEGYEQNEWLTYKQASTKGGQVLEGSKSSEVIFWNISYKFDGKFYPNKKALLKARLTEDTKGVQKFFTPRYYRVFNIAQCEGIEPRRKAKVNDAEPSVFEGIDTAEQIYEGYEGKPSLKHGGNQAYYRPSSHHVQMPKQETFVTSDDYYKTFFHELVHSTGHKDILNRKTLVESNSFGSAEYSKEELVAEIGSEFLVAITGINPKDDGKNAQAYINGWIKYLKNNPKEIISASSQAVKGVERMLTK